MTTPTALTIAGSDSSGGAGIQADLKTFAALGVYGASAISALTAQNTSGVTGIHLVPPGFLRAQIHAVFGCPAVLIKGGHGQGSESVDYLMRAGGTLALRAPRVATENTHGTGCSLSSAIAAELAKGAALETAVRNAKAFISVAIANADRFSVGHGHGPIHHFHRFY